MNPPMNMSSGATPESPLSSHSTAPAHIPATQRIYWSIRRELWEHRSIYIAPLAAAAIFLFGFLVALPHHMRGVKTLDQAHQVLDVPFHLLDLAPLSLCRVEPRTSVRGEFVRQVHARVEPVEESMAGREQLEGLLVSAHLLVEQGKLTRRFRLTQDGVGTRGQLDRRPQP